MAGKTRQSNIELLRILTICGVIVLHYNSTFGFAHAPKGAPVHYMLVGLESLFICAVDLFILVSGYYLSTTNRRKLMKVVELVLQVSIIWALRYVIFNLIEGKPIYYQDVLRSAIPNNYFVTLYLTVYLISPYLNLLTERLSLKQFRTMMILLLTLFSVIPTALDLNLDFEGTRVSGLYPISLEGSQYGYNIVNFALMYLIGAYLRREDKQLPWVICILGYAISAAVISYWHLNYGASGISYCNPLVILQAVLVFQLFQRVKLQSGLINGLAKSVFTCYLLHSWFMPYLRIPEAVNKGGSVALVHIACVVVGLYLLAWVVWKLYDLVMGPVMGWAGRKFTALDGYLSAEGADNNGAQKG